MLRACAIDRQILEYILVFMLDIDMGRPIWTGPYFMAVGLEQCLQRLVVD